MSTERPATSRLVDVMLVLTVVFVAVVAVAYVYMPDFQHAFAGVVSRAGPLFGTD
jgi:hypothetical protein